MEDIEGKINNVYTTLVDAIGTAAMYAGMIQDRNIRFKIDEMLKEEAIRLAQFRKRLFDLLSD